MKKGLIIIPTYNEKENITRMIAKIFDLRLGLEILVVDDQSPDGTGKIVEMLKENYVGLHILHRKKKEGLGRAYVAGFKWAISRDYECAFEMDADFSHDPKYLPDFLEKIKTHDLVIGSRYVNGVNVVNWPMSRLLLSYFANRYARFVTGLPIKDTTAGFKCFRISTLKILELEKISSSGYSFQIEVNYMVWKKNLSIVEIPIIFVDRQEGQSKMSTGIIREALLLIWRLKIRALFGLH